MIAETFPMSDYLITEEVRSQIDPDRTIKLVVAMRCPHCKTKLPAMEHGSKQVCVKCGLKMQCFGNSLDCFLGGK